MANKIYDFLPAHLQNKELETIFETTLERVFSKGTVDKTRVFVGRKEKGIYGKNDAYLSYPLYSYMRKNYALEPVFHNTTQNDNIFYDDIINALYNKGALTNDHRRLFKTEYETINLPVDIDKFINWQLYYWIKPGFDATFNQSLNVAYVTIDKSGGSNNWWSNNNSWYHYDDIRMFITPENKDFIEQAKRPIIEFDSRLELSDASLNKDLADNNFEEPLFKIFNSDNFNYTNKKIFHYVTGDYAYDPVLDMNVKVKSGDYVSEFIFKIDVIDQDTFKINGNDVYIYVDGNFKYRNFREEFEEASIEKIQLIHTPRGNNIDVYVNGIKKNNGYVIANDVITFSEPIIDSFVYVDYCTEYPVDTEGNSAYQRLVPELEYNIDNEDYTLVELDYSTIYEHFSRIVETRDGLLGESNGINNFRYLGDNTIKDRFNSHGSVMVRRDIDIKNMFFGMTRDDYDPIRSVEFLSLAYTNYKNRLVTAIRDILSEGYSSTMTDGEILEKAISDISSIKRTTTNIFTDIGMINSGSLYTHYESYVLDLVTGTSEQFIPSELIVLYDNLLSVVLNDRTLVLGKDYTLSASKTEIIFSNYVPVASDVVELKYYNNPEETFIPPSATKLGIHPVFVPGIIADEEYSSTVEFIVGHDGSKTPIWGDRTDSIILEYETRVYNNISDKSNTNLDSYNYINFWNASSNYSFHERNYISYPFFKKWMIRNGVDNNFNDTYDVNDWKTWNYKIIKDDAPGNWRGLFEYFYGTDNIFQEPWKILKLSDKPANFDTTHGSDYTTVAFWQSLIADSGMSVPVPVDEFGNIKTPNELFFNNSITSDDISLMQLDWEYGDGSPVEYAFRRSSEYPFVMFIQMMLQTPVRTLDYYKQQISEIVKLFNKKEGMDSDNIENERNNYTFNLGSKLAGFVNNFKMFSENTSLSNSRYTEIPSDNYKVIIHNGEPNRSEFFSAVVIEKVSLDKSHPTYNKDNISEYLKGDTVLNTSDKKYYKRKVTSPTDKELNTTINFDYSAWTLISQPKVREYGYRVYGYDDLNPTFYTLDWDKTSGDKYYSTAGDPMIIKPWVQGSLYKIDEYVTYEGNIYISVTEHTSSDRFDVDLDNWKYIKDAPRTNQIVAHGYKKTLLDQVKAYNYGDILKSVDEVAHLLVGYQHYLTAIGWNFTDTDDDSNRLDFENLLIKFLEWSGEQHTVGEFISLSPMVTTGEFSAPYGVASVRKETYKNFFRVVDSAGRLISDSDIKFYSDGDVLKWESTVPVYGMKIDISDVEHAVILDRTDSYGDTIYDPFLHNRNLRIIIDCNRVSDWNGTLTADGYLIYGDELLPNFETLVEGSRYYRDTLVDQNLEIINRLKERQIGFSPKEYLDNHGVERESQHEFFRGFLTGKGTNSSIDRLINNNSNVKKIDRGDVWAYLINDFGKLSTTRTVTKTIATNSIVNDPFVLTYDNIEYEFETTTLPYKGTFKTSGYVNSEYVNHVVSGEYDLENLNPLGIYEGDIAWLQFDTDREWDTRRLSEIAEIDFVGETADGQLYIAVTNEVETSTTVFLKINSDYIDPKINGYYYLVSDGTLDFDGLTVYKYLVFETNYEPLVVEIDSETSESIYTPTSAAKGVEAIGSVSSPNIIDGDTLVINGIEYVYDASSASSSGNIVIESDASAVDPYVTPDDRIRLVVYNTLGLVENINTVVEFGGLYAETERDVTSITGDQITIDGTTLTIDNSSVQQISIVSSATVETNIVTGKTIVLSPGGTFTFDDIEIVGTVALPELTQTKSMRVNDTNILFEVAQGSTLLTQDIVDIINASSTGLTASIVSDNIVLSYSGPSLTLQGSVIVDLGFAQTSLYSTSKLAVISEQINSNSNYTSFINGSGNIVIETALSQITVSGTALSQLGITAGTYNSVTAPTKNSIVQQINALNISGVSAETTLLGIKINKDGSSLSISEVTSGAMTRLGFDSITVNLDSIDRIISDINTQAFNNDPTVGTASISATRTVLITSPQRSISISNIIGDPLGDMGITPGSYFGSSSVVTSYIAFKDQINAVATDIQVTVTSDNRMVFTSDSPSITFAGTTQAVLDKIGLYRDYSSIKSNTNFKIMRWKSVRYTPGWNGSTFEEFYQNLGLNDISYIWADEYTTTSSWAVLMRSSNGNLSVMAKAAPRVVTEKIKRLIVNDETNSFNQYSLYDPLNEIIPGDIMKYIDYISWENPAKYTYKSGQDIWTDDHLGEIWWDTSNIRFYRYHDYGDKLGNIVIPYVRKYWGRLVPGSEVVTKKWTTSEYLPDNIKQFNTYTYFDIVRNTNVTKYYYWSTTESSNTNDMTVVDIKQMLENVALDNKFIPVNRNTIIVNNKVQRFVGDNLEFSLEYTTNHDDIDMHNEWDLYSTGYSSDVPETIYEIMKASLSNIFVQDMREIIVTSNMQLNPNYTAATVSFLSTCDFNNSVVTVNNEVVLTQNLNYSGTELQISYQHNIVVGDVIRVYRVAPRTRNLFINYKDANRHVFASLNDYLKTKTLFSIFHEWKDYIAVNDDNVDPYKWSIFNLGTWSLLPKFEKITKFDFLSKTKNFDMISLWKQGKKSFKVMTDVDEYYMEYDNELRLVNRSKTALNLDFDNIYPEYWEETYYDNLKSVQILELFNMIDSHSDIESRELRKIILSAATEYVFAEVGDRGMRIMKTSYFDLLFTNRAIAQYAVYQRDSYQDMIDYINETKPYHAKIRTVKTLYPLDENISADVDDYNHLSVIVNLGLQFYNEFVVDQDFTDVNVIYNYAYLNGPRVDVDNIHIFVNGVAIDNTYYHVENGDIVFNGIDDLLNDITLNKLSFNVGDVITMYKTYSRYDGRVLDGLSENELDIDDYDGEGLLLSHTGMTSDAGGWDTGLVNARSTEAVIVKIDRYTDETRSVIESVKFDVYDQFGRGFFLNSVDHTTISAFDGSTITVNSHSIFEKAEDGKKVLIAVENSSGNVEFMLYSKKDNTSLHIFNRSLFTGTPISIESGDTIYVFDIITNIVTGEDIDHTFILP